jgi:hypothetical protein
MNKPTFVITANEVLWTDPETLEDMDVKNTGPAYKKCAMALLSGRYPTKEEMDNE